MSEYPFTVPGCTQVHVCCAFPPLPGAYRFVPLYPAYRTCFKEFLGRLGKRENPHLLPSHSSYLLPHRFPLRHIMMKQITTSQQQLLVALNTFFH
jgi:hypothetical protein